MNMKTLHRLFAAAFLAAIPVCAGPPLICQRIDIGDAKSLPWRQVSGWQGTDPAYDVSRLTVDTLALLQPAAPIKVRMETIRRAAIYAARESGLAGELASHLMARALDAEAAGKPDPLAWFDAGYFIETLRQATFIYKYDMLTPEERTAWKLRGDKPRLDGYPWVQKAMQLGGKNMDYAESLMREYRTADLQTRAQPRVAASR